MNTKILSEFDIDQAVSFLKNDELVALPTETVYGLAANALSESAVRKVFVAKGRPSDNPLIVHIANLDMLDFLVSEFGKVPFAKLLAENFWPGPLTIILPKTKAIPMVTSGGLDTVAIRFPSHPTFQKIISKAGFPIAAPSANLSGKPSPTIYKHVFDDMNGRIAAIMKCGDCKFGVESTIINLCCGTPKIMRPGSVSFEKILNFIPNLVIDDAVCGKFIQDDSNVSQKNICPGMKYRHYAPKTHLTIVKGGQNAFFEFLGKHKGEKMVALCFDEDTRFLRSLDIPFVAYGSEKNPESQAKNLFSSLRASDDFNADIIYARCPSKNGVGLAVFNRILRAAEFDIQ